MKKIISILLAAMLVFSLAACGSTQTPETSVTQPAGDTAASELGGTAERETDGNEQSAVSEEIPSEEQDGGADSESGSNILVAYFSLAGEQYAVGVIEEGNTGIIAHMIAEQTGADLFEIEAVTPYPETYSELLAVSQEEMNNNARPEIVGTVENMADYDTVFIGFPIWLAYHNLIQCTQV